MRKMSDAEKIGNSGKMYDVNRLTPYVNRLHAFIFGNFNYVNRLHVYFFGKTLSGNRLLR